MMDVLAYADGAHDLVALADRIGAPAMDCAAVAVALAAQGLLVETHEDRPSARASSSTGDNGRLVLLKLRAWTRQGPARMIARFSPRKLALRQTPMFSCDFRFSREGAARAVRGWIR